MTDYQYKESGIEWLGEIPEHWKTDRLKDCLIINDETLSSNTDDEFFINYLDISNVDSGGVVDYSKIKKIKFGEAPSRARRIVKLFDTIISSVRTNLQAVAYIDFEKENLICSTGFFVCRPKHEDTFFNKYLYYVLLSEYAKHFFSSRSVGVSYPAIDEHKFSKLNIAFPKYNEQKAIAEYLDTACQKIDRVIAKKEQQIEKINSYLRSRVLEIVKGDAVKDCSFVDTGNDIIGNIPSDWSVKRLKRVLSKINSGVTPKGGATSYVENGIPLIRSQNVTFDGLKMEDVVFIDEETHESMSNSKVQNGDVLLNITGASMGRCFYVEEIDEANVNQHVCILRPRYRIITKYLYFLLFSEIGQSQIFSGYTGSGREGLNFQAIKNFKVPLPDIETQKNIVTQLDTLFEKVREQKRVISDQLKMLKKYKKSLIHECVTGKKQVFEGAIDGAKEKAFAAN